MWVEVGNWPRPQPKIFKGYNLWKFEGVINETNLNLCAPSLEVSKHPANTWNPKPSKYFANSLPIPVSQPVIRTDLVPTSTVIKGKFYSNRLSF